jgi:hypothetical protein
MLEIALIGLGAIIAVGVIAIIALLLRPRGADPRLAELNCSRP